MAIRQKEVTSQRILSHKTQTTGFVDLLWVGAGTESSLKED